jgi:hypothetical protein
MVPGFGIVFDRRFEVARPEAISVPSWYFQDPIVVNCPWALAKISPESLDAIAAIVEATCESVTRSQRPWTQLVFRFFTNSQPSQTLHLHVLKRRVEQRIVEVASCVRSLPASWEPPVAVEVLPGMPISMYMSLASRAHVMLDMFPYSGCLTVLVRPTFT